MSVCDVPCVLLIFPRLYRYSSLSMGLVEKSLRRLTGGIVTKYRTKPRPSEVLLSALLWYQSCGGAVVCTTDSPRVWNKSGFIQDQHAFTLRYLWRVKVSDGSSERKYTMVELLDPYGHVNVKMPPGLPNWLPGSAQWQTTLGKNMRRALGNVDPEAAGARGVFYIDWELFHLFFLHVYCAAILHDDFKRSHADIKWHVGVLRLPAPKLAPFHAPAGVAVPSREFTLSPVFAIGALLSSTMAAVAHCFVTFPVSRSQRFLCGCRV